MKEKCVKILKISVLLAIGWLVAGCASSRKTISYPKKHRNRCNCPHFSQADVSNHRTIEIKYL